MKKQDKTKLLREVIKDKDARIGQAEARANLAERRLDRATRRLVEVAAWLAPSMPAGATWDFETRIKHSAAQTLKEIGEMR